MKVKHKSSAKYYSPLEEKINIISHGIGLILSIIALLILIIHAVINGSSLHIISFTIFGCSLILLYTASTVYHSTQQEVSRRRLRVFDHAAIYILIAGTYTPFALITIGGTTGWVIFGLSWGIATIGITLKLFFTGRFKVLSTLIYISMGWMIIFFLEPLMNSLSANGLIMIAVGGVSYTIGALLYSIKKIKFNHAIFHIFVLIGSFAHFLAVYFYILPH